MRKGGDFEQLAHLGAAATGQPRQRCIDIGGGIVRGGINLERGGPRLDAEAVQEFRLLDRAESVGPHRLDRAHQCLKIHVRREIERARRCQRIGKGVSADRLKGFANVAGYMSVVDHQCGAALAGDAPAQVHGDAVTAPFEDRIVRRLTHVFRQQPLEIWQRIGRKGESELAFSVDLDLPLAVVSGSVALGFGEPFFRAAQDEMDLRCGLSFARGARIVPGGLGDRGPLIGAARVGLIGVGAEGEASAGARAEVAG